VLLLADDDDDDDDGVGNGSFVQTLGGSRSATRAVVSEQPETFTARCCCNRNGHHALQHDRIPTEHRQTIDRTSTELKRSINRIRPSINRTSTENL
jgi:hypothetical protein